MKLEQGRPADLTGRLPKEVRVYDLLDNLGIEYQRIDHEAAMTMEACAAIDEVLDATICKNLLLCNRQCTAFYLLLLSSRKFSYSRLSIFPFKRSSVIISRFLLISRRLLSSIFF